MNTVSIQIKEGKRSDQVLYIAGLLIILFGFLTMYDFILWRATKNNWQPFAILGLIIIIVTFLFSLQRKKLSIVLLENQENSVKITPLKRVVFSGMQQEEPIELNKNDIRTVKIEQFQNRTSGTYTAVFETTKDSIIVLLLKEFEVTNLIIKFAQEHLSESEIILNSKKI